MFCKRLTTSIFLFFLFFLAAGVESPCSAQSAKRMDDPRNAMRIAILRVGKRAKAPIQLRCAESTADRSRGLSHVTLLPENEGMLFLYPEESRRCFWMKDTFIPLDILFLDSEFRILEYVQHAPPDHSPMYAQDGSGLFLGYQKITEDPFIVTTKSEKIRYVVELNSEQIMALGLQNGEQLSISFTQVLPR